MDWFHTEFLFGIQSSVAILLFPIVFIMTYIAGEVYGKHLLNKFKNNEN